jgi:hypothetical protein
MKTMNNKRFGRIITVIAIMLLTTGLIAGCGNSGSTGSSATSPEATTEPELQETSSAAESDTEEVEATTEATETGTDITEEQTSQDDADSAEEWDFTIQIQDQSLTFPSTIKGLSDIGFKLDDFDVSADTKIDAGAYESVMFTDGTHRVLFHISNTDSSAKAASDCIVDTISVTKAEADEGLKVVLPGDIQIGSTLDDVNEKYAEPTYIYEGDSSNYYIWSTEDAKGSCTLIIDNETKKVTGIEYGTK